MYCYTHCPQPCSRPPPTHASTGDFWTLTGNMGQSPVGSLLPSPGSWCTRYCLSPRRVLLPVLCKFSQLYVGVNGDLLQEGLCHTQVCGTQSPWPCGRPLLTCTSTGDTQTQFYLSLCGVPESWYAQGLFEPSWHFWWKWDLILNANSPLLPSCWGFSFALGCGISAHSCSSPCHLTAVSLTLDGGISSRPVQWSTAATICMPVIDMPKWHIWGYPITESEASGHLVLTRLWIS